MKVNVDQSVLKNEAQSWEQLIETLDQHEGCFFACDYTYPERYHPWQVGLSDPLIKIQAWGLYFEIESLNKEKNGILEELYKALKKETYFEKISSGYSSETGNAIVIGQIKLPNRAEAIDESQRSRQNSIFTLMRTLLSHFETECPVFGLYGNYGYGLVHQFETLTQGVHFNHGSPDLVLYLPQKLLYKANAYEKAVEIRYDYILDESPINESGNAHRENIANVNGTYEDIKLFHQCLTAKSPPANPKNLKVHSPQEDYELMVKQLKPLFERGELFEGVPSYERLHPCNTRPSALFKRLRAMNPSPFHYLVNSGQDHLIGASPEMYVRVTQGTVETCPISGTIPRGIDSLSDHSQIRKLMNSQKDEDELTMCTDVDRNDKSKVCDPATIKVLGRRQIEMYSHLIHTVDHVSGKLRLDRDGIDAFIAHMWAVTVTGAPKKAAMNWIESNEKSARQWYGGAIGYMTVNGDINTGLTLRGIQLKEGIASVRVGATILYDSDPHLEALETQTKAAAMEAVIQEFERLQIQEKETDLAIKAAIESGTKTEKNVETKLNLKYDDSINKTTTVLVIDHDDSFVHTLAGYFEKQGCQVTTIRQSNVRQYFESLEKEEFLDKDESHENENNIKMIHHETKKHLPDLMVLSPGPGTPEDFKLHHSIAWALEKSIPLFGVCLGLQGIVTYFGGELGQLKRPMHGKSSFLKRSAEIGNKEEEGIKEKQGIEEKNEKALFQLREDQEGPRIGRYHSLYALKMPDSLSCYAVTDDACPMAVYHKDLPIWAVQFHPESIMSAEDNFGTNLIENLVRKVRELNL